jgi:hypothetical protein
MKVSTLSQITTRSKSSKKSIEKIQSFIDNPLKKPRSSFQLWSVEERKKLKEEIYDNKLILKELGKRWNKLSENKKQNWENPRRLNVALTRARYGLIIVGNIGDVDLDYNFSSIMEYMSIVHTCIFVVDSIRIQSLEKLKNSQKILNVVK